MEKNQGNKQISGKARNRRLTFWGSFLSYLMQFESNVSYSQKHMYTWTICPHFLHILDFLPGLSDTPSTQQEKAQ